MNSETKMALLKALNTLKSGQMRIRQTCVASTSQIAGFTLSLIEQCQQLALDIQVIIGMMYDNDEIVDCLKDYDDAANVISSALASDSGLSAKQNEHLLDRMGALLQQAEDVLENEAITKDVVILTDRMCAWKEVEPVWSVMTNMSGTDVYVMPVPYYYKNFDGSIRGSVRFERDNYPANVRLLDYNLYDFHPDMMIIQNQFDQSDCVMSIHPDYYSDILREKSRLLVCFSDLYHWNSLIYRVEEWEKAVDKIVSPLILNADFIFVRDDSTREIYISVLSKHVLADRDYWSEKIRIDYADFMKTWISDDPPYAQRLNYDVLDIDYRSIFAWWGQGRKSPPPHAYKKMVVRGYAIEYDLNHFVETGTYMGDMVMAQIKTFDSLASIELSDQLYNDACERFKEFSHVSLYHGDSGKIMNKVLDDIDDDNVLFWLDGHYSSGVTAKGESNTPILDELDIVLGRYPEGSNVVILIDDARLFVGENDYPTLHHLKEYVYRLRDIRFFEVKDDIIRIVL